VRPFLVTGIMGAMFGCIVAGVPISINYHQVLSDCTRYVTAADCTSFPQCMWPSHAATCGFRDLSAREADARCDEPSSTTCVAPCSWDDDHNHCRHLPLWTPTQVGVFAGAHIAGGTVTALAGSLILRHLFKGDLRVGNIACGVTAIVGLALGSAGWCVNGDGELGNYWLFVVGRFVIGLTLGLGAIVAPLFATLLAQQSDRTLVGLVFGPGMALGNVITSAVSLAVNPVHLPAQSSQKLYLVLNLPATLLALTVVVVSASAPVSGRGSAPEGGALLGAATEAPEGDSPVSMPFHGRKDIEQHDQETVVNGGALVTDHHALRPASFAGRIAVGVVLATALQFTGITAVMAFAPQMAESGGLDALLGNFLFMAWNFITTLGAIPLSRRYSCRKLFVIGAFAASVSCLLTGVPTLVSTKATHGSTAYNAMEVLIVIGVLAVIMAYELGMGATYYVLAQSVFDDEERRVGTAATIAWQFACTLTINFAYAPVQSLLSGNGVAGSSGNQREGQGWLFVAFGVIGLLTALFLLRYLRPSELHSVH
jgi:uncharacterized membrane protein YciS (DUF1049 family)